MVSNKSVPDYVEDAAEVFKRDGFLIAKGLYSPEEMLDWKARIVGILEAGGISARTRRLPASTYSCRRRWTPSSGTG